MKAYRILLARVDTTNGCAHTRTLTYTAVDGCGNSNTCTQVFVWKVDTTPPVFTCASNKTVACGSAWSFDVPTAADICCGTNVTVTVLNTVTNGPCPLAITRTWLATDCCGNTNTCSQTVTLLDTTPPVFTCVSNALPPSVVGDSWSNCGTNSPLAARFEHSAVWTGTRLIVWGGFDGTTYFGDGARFDPATGAWTPMASGPLTPRRSAIARN